MSNNVVKIKNNDNLGKYSHFVDGQEIKIAIDDIKIEPNLEYQTRGSNFENEDHIKDLENSIMNKGELTNPLEVYIPPNGKEAVILKGHNRHEAMTNLKNHNKLPLKLLNKGIPCIVRRTPPTGLQGRDNLMCDNAHDPQIGNSLEDIERQLSASLKKGEMAIPTWTRDTYAKKSEKFIIDVLLPIAKRWGPTYTISKLKKCCRGALDSNFDSYKIITLYTSDSAKGMVGKLCKITTFNKKGFNANSNKLVYVVGENGNGSKLDQLMGQALSAGYNLVDSGEISDLSELKIELCFYATGNKAKSSASIKDLRKTATDGVEKWNEICKTLVASNGIISKHHFLPQIKGETKMINKLEKKC